MPFLAILKLIPAQVWVGAAIVLVVVLGLWKITSDAEDKGAAGATTKIERANEKAEGWADDAERTVENCTGTWDRARGVCVREGAGAGN